MNEKILLIGCGNLGSLLLNNWLDKRKLIKVIENNNVQRRSLKKKFNNCKFYSNLDEIVLTDFDIIVLCVKPKDSKKVIRLVSKNIRRDQCFVSLVAGLKIRIIRSFLKSKNIFRVMPNIFASVGSSSTALFCEREVKKPFKIKVENLFRYLGNVFWLKKESELDFFTALYGGGPAYIFYFLDTLCKISEKEGLSSKDSRNLINELIFGTAKYIQKNNIESFSSLIKIVASKGGTTEEALKYLKSKLFYNIMNEAIAKASSKSKKISNNIG